MNWAFATGQVLCCLLGIISINTHKATTVSVEKTEAQRLKLLAQNHMASKTQNKQTNQTETVS